MLTSLLTTLLFYATTIVAASPSDETSTALWSTGFENGFGVRYLPTRDVPDNTAPRFDILVWELRRLFPGPHEYRITPDRVDGQIDWYHHYITSWVTTRPRRSATLYTTWLHPAGKKRDWALSAGMYGEIGHDRYVSDDQLAYGPAVTYAPALRFGVEKPRYEYKHIQVGTYIRLAAGVTVASDPNHPQVSRFGRLGFERSWTWRRRK